MTEITWPAITDDDGTGQYGTPVDKAWTDAVETAINALLHSATNPTVTPADITDEVVTARGSLGALHTRMSVALNNDGTLKTQASLITATQLGSVIGAKNILWNENFLMWPFGDAAAPVGWTLSGSPVIARCGTGLTDTARKVGPFCASVTYGAASGFVAQTVLDAGVWPVSDFLEGLDISAGAWIKTSIASHARIYIYSVGGGTTYSSYHTGSGNWEWLTVTVEVSAAATNLEVGAAVHSAGTIYVSGMTAIVGSVPPGGYIPCDTAYGQLEWSFVGVPEIGDDQRRWSPARPTLIKDIQGACKTAPGGGNSFDIEIQVYDGASWQDMVTDQTLIATTALYGGVQPDGDYAYRCLTGVFGATPDDGQIRLNLTNVDDTEDVSVYVRGLQYLPAFEFLKAYNDL